MKLETKISYGLYLVSTNSEGKDNGCIVNTFTQLTENPACFSVTINQQTLTCQMVKQSKELVVGILSTKTNFDYIKALGLTSGRDKEKYANFVLNGKEGNMSFPNEYLIGYFVLKVISVEDLGSHSLFICQEVKRVELADDEPLTYAYYQNHIKPKPVANGYVCTVCGYVHQGEMSDDFICPLCLHGKDYFEKIGGNNKMSKFVCSVCGYVHEGEQAPLACPICKAGQDKFVAQSDELTWAAEHVVGVASGAPKEILDDLRANFQGECSEVGMYLAMARVAYREGYPEIGMYYEKAAYEEAEHAAKFAELLGEVLTNSTKRNLEMRIEAENGATMGKTNLAKAAKELGMDATHDTVHEMGRDEARHGKAFLGLYNRYFKR